MIQNEYKKVPVPKPGPDEVLINIKDTGGELRHLFWFDGWFPVINLDLSLPYRSSRKSPVLDCGNRTLLTMSRHGRVTDFCALNKT